LGLAVTAGAIYGLYRLGGWLYRDWQRLKYLSPIPAILIFWYIIPWYVRATLRALNEIIKPKIRITLMGKQVVISHIMRSLRFDNYSWLTFSLADRVRSRVSIECPTTIAYRDSAAKLTAAQKVGRPIPFFAGTPVPVSLEVSNTIESLPWEALLQTEAAFERKYRERFQFWRTRSALAPVVKAQGDALLICSPDARRTFENPWRSRITPAKGSLQVVTTNIVISYGPVRVAHIIGRTRHSGGGFVLQLGGTDNYIRADELSKLKAEILIVQCQPVDTLRRSDIDREQTAEMRGFAHELAGYGARVVIFLPQLPAEVASEVTARLARMALARSAPKRFEVLDVVSDVRKKIAKAITPALQQRLQRTVAADLGSVNDFRGMQAQEEMTLDVTVWFRTNQ
jgi:hypothetical protein